MYNCWWWQGKQNGRFIKKIRLLWSSWTRKTEPLLKFIADSIHVCAVPKFKTITINALSNVMCKEFATYFSKVRKLAKVFVHQRQNVYVHIWAVAKGSKHNTMPWMKRQDCNTSGFLHIKHEYVWLFKHFVLGRKIIFGLIKSLKFYKTQTFCCVLSDTYARTLVQTQTSFRGKLNCACRIKLKSFNRK